MLRLTDRIREDPDFVDKSFGLISGLDRNANVLCCGSSDAADDLLGLAGRRASFLAIVVVGHLDDKVKQLLESRLRLDIEGGVLTCVGERRHTHVERHLLAIKILVDMRTRGDLLGTEELDA